MTDLSTPDLCASAVAWHPASGSPPQIRVLADRLNLNDLALTGPGLGLYWPFGSVIDTFAGHDPDLRKAFQDTFKDYLNAPHTFPGCNQPDASTLDLYTYRKPYEYHQATFLTWLEKYTERNDFLNARARKWNTYRGDLTCPVVKSWSMLTEEMLQRTFGYAAVVDQDVITLIGDNKYNPLRWIAPINEIHHHEQASLAITLPAKKEQLHETEAIFAAFLAGDRSRHILLEYCVDVEVVDLRKEMKELTVWDFYNGTPLAEAQDLVGRTHSNAERYIKPAAQSHGQALHPVLRESISKWLDTRFIPPNIQLGVMVNWRETSSYRLSEFMVASMNQQPANYYPAQEGAEGFRPTANERSIDMLLTEGVADLQDGLEFPLACWATLPSPQETPVCFQY